MSSSSPRILAFAGSARQDSFNKKLVRVAARGAEQAGVSCTLIDLRDFPLPVYDGDLEQREGLPGSAQKLRELFSAHQGLLIASPEHNSSISALLKNTIDWVSRSPEGKPDLSCFRGRSAALLSASIGALGGIRGLVSVRSLLGNVGVMVVPDQYCLGHAHKAFGPDGALLDEDARKRAEQIGAELARVTRKLED
jgi:NAD(P)H-dependent FMN reductase